MKKFIKITFILVCIISNSLFAQIENKIFEYKKANDEISFKGPTEYDIFYNEKLDKYILRKKFGNANFGESIVLSKEEYINFILSDKIKDYYLNKSRAYDLAYKQSRKKNKDQYKDVIGVLPSFKIKSKLFEKIFGGDGIEFLPSGFASFDLGIFNQFIDNPNIFPANRKNFSIDINQKIQIGISGKIGERLSIGANYDTQSGFAFENRLNLAWTSSADDDNILQKIEVGNVNFPLSTSLIPGIQSLFGVRTDLKVGKTKISAVISNQQSQSTSLNLQGGNAVNTFKISPIDYDLNQHYLLGQYFRNNYSIALKKYPIINSSINITKIEIWKIDFTNSDLTNQRSILGLRDLGEENSSTPPTNSTIYNQVKSLGNGITSFENAKGLINGATINGVQYVDGEHFALHGKARKLKENEYKLNPQTGYISLVQPLDDKELLCASYQYSKIGTTQLFQVGEFSTDSKDLLIVKLLKSNSLVNTSSPLWDLMMKNIYSIGNARNISTDGFIFNIKYQSPSNGALEYFPTGNLQGKRFLNEFNLDKLNANNQSTPKLVGDGFFDFIPNLTIIPDLGKVVFTQLEPFGIDLDTRVSGDTNYVFNELYNTQKIEAKANPLANRYFFDGRYKGEAGSEGSISLGAINVAKGSVIGMANNTILVEGTDYIVDYQLGTVTIINEVLKNSNTPITFNIENNSLFNIQKKSFFGINVEHPFSENLLVGFTFANYGERPLTQKAQFGVESLNNSMVGANINWKNEAPFLSRITDFIPFARTNGKSNIQITAEGAYLIPGTKGTIEDQSYIDDFESSQSKINLKNSFSWKLSSTPKLNPLFPNGDLTNNLQNGYQRGLLSWYEIDPSFYSTNKSLISNSEINLNSSRRVDIKEIYENRQLDVNNPNFINTFDLSFFPKEKGPYNFNSSNELPQSRWAGISTPLSITNFENSNIQYLEFWMMDPFSDGAGSSGELLLHLGNISEDVLSDGKMLYENGLVSNSNPTSETTSTICGVQPKDSPTLYAFTTENESRNQQDIGYDGLFDLDESLKFGISSTNPISLRSDPSNDNFLSYLDPAWNSNSIGTSLINRYKYFQGTEGNTPSKSNLQINYIPDVEDLNQDFNLDTAEAYYEFKVKINSSDFNTIGNNYIVDKKNTIVTLPDGSTTSTNWYQFRIPVNQGVPIGGISNLTSIRYLRMLMTGFSSQTTLRFGTLDLVRGDWASYTKNIFPKNGLEGTSSEDNENFEVSIANIEENGNRKPPYVLPPGILRENLSSTTSFSLQQNEQSLSLRVKDFKDDAKAVFKTGNFDLRRYNKLKMFVHAQNLDIPASSSFDSDIRFFIRVGSDLVDNYYEFETSLKYTSNNAISDFEIWPQENNIEILLNDLILAKNERDNQPNLSSLILQRFAKSTSDPNKIIYIKGRPSIGMITNIMIGVRNSGNNPKNVLVWVNELRLSGIDKKSSYAGRANINFNLADLASFNLSGNYISSGFGAINQSSIQRGFEENIGYSISTNMSLEKFLPEKWNLVLPMALSYSRNIINPEFNPLDSDVSFNNISNSFVKDAIQQVQTSKSITFPTIKKLPSSNKESKPAIYDIENFSSSFSYSENNLKDIQIQTNQTKDLNISLDYAFSPSPLEIKPFKFLFNKKPSTSKIKKDSIAGGNSESLNKERFKWIKDFNFNPKPSNFSLRTLINRNYNQLDFRDVSALLNNTFTTIPIASTFGNRFIFNIVGSTGINLTKSLVLNYQINNSSLVNNNLQSANENIIWKDLLNPGTPIDHSQIFTAAYVVPTNYFFNMDWVSLDFNFNSNYNWRNNSQILTDADLGFIVQNNSNLNTNLGVDFNRIYYKAFDKVKSEYDSISTSRKNSLSDFINKLEKTKSNEAYNSILKSNVKFKSFFKPKHYLYTIATSIKNISFNHKIDNGSTLPGFLLSPSFLGLTNTIPSLAYIIGTDFDLKKRAIEQGWITTNDLLTSPYARNHAQTINASILIEPISDASINLNFNNTYSESSLQSGFNDPLIGNKVFNNQLLSYNTSYLSIGSAFNRESTFSNFVTIAKGISQQLGTIDSDGDGFTDGYNLTNSAVLIPAFNSAINGKSTPNNSNLRFRNTIPLPNWNVTYSGLNSVPWFAKRFSQIDLSHSYQSNYVLNGVQSNPNFYAFENGTLPSASNGTNNRFDNNNNFHNQYLFQEISITESFSPLLGIDVKLKNNLQLSTKYNRSRITTLGLLNYSISENFLDDITLGVGYTFKDVKLSLNFNKSKSKYRGDVLLRTDFSFMRRKARIYDFLTNSSNIFDDQDLIAIKVSTEFNPVKNLSFRFFYDQLISKFRISSLFSSNITRAGLSITFNILNSSSNLNTNNNTK